LNVWDLFVNLTGAVPPEFNVRVANSVPIVFGVDVTNISTVIVFPGGPPEGPVGPALLSGPSGPVVLECFCFYHQLKYKMVVIKNHLYSKNISTF
jgi:hypothetical protein